MKANTMKKGLVISICTLSLIGSMPAWSQTCWQAGSPASDEFQHLPLMAQRTTSAAIFNHNIDAKIKALKTKPKLSVEQRLELAQAWWQIGLIEGNVFHINNALKIITPQVHIQQPPAIYLLRSKLNMSLHRYKQATGDLKAAILASKKSPNDALLSEVEQLQQQIEFLSGKARLYTDDRYAEKQDATMASTAMESTATLSSQVQYLLAHNKLKQAQLTLNQAIAKFNDSHPIVAVALHLLSAQVAGANKQFALQLAHLNKALVRLPTHAGALKAMANVHHANQHYPKAIECLNQARETSPDPNLLVALADNYRFANQLELAYSLRQQANNKLQMMSKLFPLSYGAKNHHHEANHAHTH